MRNQHTRNKYTLCHKETIALNDEKSRVEADPKGQLLCL